MPKMMDLKNKKPLEMRMVPASFATRAEGETGTITGRAIVFNSRTDLGWFDEIIDPRALDQADLSDVRLCLNHDTSYVYARSRRNRPNSTMRLDVNPQGMDIEADLAIGQSARHMDYFTAVEREDMDKMSFMFSVDADEWEGLDTDHPLRRITRISSVVEVSVVTFPAYESTTAEIKERSKEALERARSQMEIERRQKDDEAEARRLEMLKMQNENRLRLIGGTTR